MESKRLFEDDPDPELVQMENGSWTQFMVPGESITINGRLVAHGLTIAAADRLCVKWAEAGRVVEVHSVLPWKNGVPQGPPGASYVRRRVRG